MPAAPPPVDRLHPLERLRLDWKDLNSLDRALRITHVHKTASHFGPDKLDLRPTNDESPEGASPETLAGWAAADDGQPSSTNPYCAWRQPSAFASWIEGWQARVDAEAIVDFLTDDEDDDED